MLGLWFKFKVLGLGLLRFYQA